MTDLLNALSNLGGMPADLLIALSCIVLGYVLRGLRKFPNDGIPLACVLWAAVLNPIIADPAAASTSPRAWIVKQVLVGMVIGFFAWAFHKAILSRFEDKIPGLKKLLVEDQTISAAAAPPHAVAATTTQPGAGKTQ